MNEQEKNLQIVELTELLKEQTLKFLGPELLEEDGEKFTDAVTTGVEAAFGLLVNLTSLMLMRYIVAGVSKEEAKTKIKEVLDLYSADTVGIALKRVESIESAISILGPKHRGH